MRSRKGSFRQNTSGAVLVEFTVALMPLLLAFFVFFQVAVMATGKMFVRRATISAARAGIVMSGGDTETNPMLGGAIQGTDQDIQNAFQAGLGMWGANGNGMLTGTVVISDPGVATGPLTATSTVQFQCRVPLGKLICSGSTITMTDTATLPKQGARYK